MVEQAAKWDEDKILPVETLRKAAALGFGGIYVRDDVGGSALGRLDAAIIFEALATVIDQYSSFPLLFSFIFLIHKLDICRAVLVPQLI